MKYFFSLLLILANIYCVAQSEDVWTAFDDSEGYRYGFKNSKGEVMIPPKFMGFSVAGKFDKIFAAMEDVDGKFDSYYLLKNGKKFGGDSMYVFDMAYDCESEGMIKFRDPKTDKTGMFNELGQVAIPAEYSDMTSFKNGMSITLKGAEKKHWGEQHDSSGCNHWSWVGGQELLINRKNEILIESFPRNEELDFYSLEISDEPNRNISRVNFLGVNKKYYSFIDNEKLFTNFLHHKFLNDLSAENLIENSYPKIIYWDDGNGWTLKKREAFVKEKFTTLSEKLGVIKKTDANYQVASESYFSYPDAENKEFESYYDNCGNWNTSKYPIYNLIITHRNKQGDFSYQDHFTFAKLKDKFQLISCTMRK